MYRTVFLCLIIGGTSSVSTKNFSKSAVERFHQLAQNVDSLDKEAHRICNGNDFHTTATFCGTFYQLRVHLPAFTEDSFKVQIKGRVLLLQGTKGGKTFSELKILPDLVSSKDAAWMFKNGYLTVRMVYAYTSLLGKAITEACSTVPDDAVVEVPKRNDLDANSCTGEKKHTGHSSIV